jgi:hypothetical protein
VIDSHTLDILSTTEEEIAEQQREGHRDNKNNHEAESQREVLAEVGDKTIHGATVL